MNRPRTPENFPRMKDRAAGRHARRFVAALPSALEAFGRITAAVVDVLTEAVARFANGIRGAMLQSAYALAPPPVVAHAAIDDPEGRELVERILERKRAAQGPGSLGLSTPV